METKWACRMGRGEGKRGGRGADLILALFITHRSLKDTEDWRDRQDRTKNAREIGWKEESREREKSDRGESLKEVTAECRIAHGIHFAQLLGDAAG